MRRIVLGIQYDGRSFVGFQVQPNGKSVQGELESAFLKLTGNAVKVTGSGRTDAGVHAIEQIVHFDLSNDSITMDNLVRGTNSLLPESIKVLWAKEASNSFHAQKSAKLKTYCYVCYVSSVPLPLLEGRALHLLKMPNLTAIKKASKCLIGTHDFGAFCASKSGRENFVRTVTDIKIYTKTLVVPLLVFEVTGTGFLYKQVRNMVGTLLETDQSTPNRVKEILESKNRKMAGKTAPAQGLYLKQVCYLDE